MGNTQPNIFDAIEKQKSIEKVQELINEKCDLNVRDSRRRTPLHTAYIMELYDIMKLLIKSRADVNAVDNDGNSVLHLMCMWGVKDTEIVELLITFGIDINAMNKDNKTPLHIASSERKNNIAILLIKNGADIEKKDKEGYPPLRYSIWYKNKEISKLLIDNPYGKKADINILINTNKETKNVYYNRNILLIDAIYSGCLDTIELLLKKGTIDINNMSFLTGRNVYLECVFESNYPDIIDLLVKYNLDYNKVYLGYFKSYNKPEFCKKIEHMQKEYFLNNYHMLEAKDEDGNTPLHIAVSRPQFIDAVKVILDNGADPNILNDFNESPLKVALNNKNLEAIKLLFENGADSSI